MDDFEKLAKLVGAPVEAAQCAGLPQSLKEAKALGSRWYFTGKPCKHGHTKKRTTTTSECHGCSRLRSSTPESKEYQRLNYAKPEVKESNRLRNSTPEAKYVKRMRDMKKTGDAVLFAINQAWAAATRGRAPADIVTQCPEQHRTQLQHLIDRIRADPKAGKAVIALLRTMRELRKTELAEAKNEAR
jgi:hypothetical protein